MATSPYTVSTGPYTADQLEGEACTRCGRPFAVGESSYPTGRVGGGQLFAHITCPKGGAKR